MATALRAGNFTHVALRQADHPDLVREYMIRAGEKIETLRCLVIDSLSYTASVERSRAIYVVALAEAAIRVHRRVIGKNAFGFLDAFLRTC